jgi:hypothetical protein
MRTPLSLLLLLASAPAAGAQTLFSYDGAALFVADYHGGPDPATCGYPTGPVIAAWPAPPGGPCPTPLPLPPAPAPGVPGDVAYDATTDTVLVSDGAVIATYTAAGAFVSSVFSPLPVFGMGVDAAAGLLWCTDGGGLAYALALPPAGACGALAVIAIAPFPVPGPGPLTDIDWHAPSGTLFAASLAGAITNFLPGGLPGPFGVFGGSGLAIPAGAPVVGLAVDDASPFGPPHLYITDGVMIEAILAPGAPAPPTFSMPFPAFPSAIPTHGLAFAPHGVPYGVGADPDGLPAPVNTPVGPATTPGPLFTHVLSSAVPGGIAALIASTGFACPAFPLLGLKTFLSPFGPTPTLATVLVPASGTVTVATPLPPGLPVGVSLYDQWFVLKPLGPSPLQVSNAVHFRTSLP